MRNCNHNTVHELNAVLDAVWRYEQYIKDAEQDGHPLCVNLWKELRDCCQQHAEKLRQTVVGKANHGHFD